MTRKARAHLSNGELADLTLGFTSKEECKEWIRDIILAGGIVTNESFIPLHSIVYILFGDLDTQGYVLSPEAEAGKKEFVVEFEPELANGE